MKLYIARMTRRYTDYGELMGSENGIVWCGEDGYAFTGGFERGKTIESVRERVKALEPRFGEPLELIELDPIVTTFDMNPRGDI